MEGIDWNGYVQLCGEAVEPPIERFAQALRRSAIVATKQSISIYTGVMEASLITAFRQMVDILKKLAETLPESEREKIRWKDVENRMRESYLERLSGIDNMVIAVDYMNTRIHNKRSDYRELYQWINGLQDENGVAEIDRLYRRTIEEAVLFAEKDVPVAMALSSMGIKKR